MTTYEDVLESRKIEAKAGECLALLASIRQNVAETEAANKVIYAKADEIAKRTADQEKRD